MTQQKSPQSSQPNSEEKIWGAVSYLWILSLVVLAARKKNEFIRFHANQGILLFIISVAALILGPIGMLLNILIVIVSITGIIKALKGETWTIPVVGQFAAKIGDWLVKTLKL